MFCPRCGRQQVSDNVRFCSGCGFQLNVVKALIGDDVASLSNSEEFKTANRSQRKKDMTIGAVLMVGLALHSAWTTEDLSLDREYTSLIVKCLILCVLIHLTPVIRAFISASMTRNSLSSSEMPFDFTARFKNNDQNYALPPTYARPAADYVTERIATAELAPPPSITEDTTDLLRHS